MTARLARLVLLAGLTLGLLTSGWMLAPADAGHARGRTAWCVQAGETWYVNVAWYDYGTTVEPYRIALSRQTPRGMDYTVSVRDDGGSYWSRSGRIAGTYGIAWAGIDNQVSVRRKDRHPRVNVWFGPYGQAQECFLQIRLYQ